MSDTNKPLIKFEDMTDIGAKVEALLAALQSPTSRHDLLFYIGVDDWSQLSEADQKRVNAVLDEHQLSREGQVAMRRNRIETGHSTLSPGDKAMGIKIGMNGELSYPTSFESEPETAQPVFGIIDRSAALNTMGVNEASVAMHIAETITRKYMGDTGLPPITPPIATQRPGGEVK